jgi:hypothetical protein
MTMAFPRTLLSLPHDSLVTLAVPGDLLSLSHDSLMTMAIPVNLLSLPHDSLMTMAVPPDLLHPRVWMLTRQLVQPPPVGLQILKSTKIIRTIKFLHLLKRFILKFTLRVLCLRRLLSLVAW